MSQKSYSNNVPTLYIIPTPVGNMEDITIRALNVLKDVDVIFCEDTRVTKQLLSYFNIEKKLISCHKFTENIKLDKVIEYLNTNSKVGLVSDRGTPIISDPGYEIAKGVIDAGFNVVSLPGATAFVPALTMSGIVPQPFLFYGFLNSKSSKRKEELNNIKDLDSTIILKHTALLKKQESILPVKLTVFIIQIYSYLSVLYLIETVLIDQIT